MILRCPSSIPKGFVPMKPLARATTGGASKNLNLRQLQEQGQQHGLRSLLYQSKRVISTNAMAATSGNTQTKPFVVGQQQTQQHHQQQQPIGRYYASTATSMNPIDNRTKRTSTAILAAGAAAMMVAMSSTTTSRSDDASPSMNEKGGHPTMKQQRPHQSLLQATIVSSKRNIGSTWTTQCDDGTSSSPSSDQTNGIFPKHIWTPAKVATEDLAQLVEDHDDDKMANYPIYTSDQVAENDGSDGKPIWMSYGGVVYDVTHFISNHPGGSEKILMAAGSSIEPFWHTYRQHFASDLPIRLMEHMVIGRLDEKDQDAIDEQMDIIYETSVDPFANEPVRHKALRVHSEHSMNAETPDHLLTRNYLTPNSLFYIRHHHPVPFLTGEQIKNFQLEIDLSAFGKGIQKFTLDELKQLPKTEVVATLQCSGNRRSGFNKVQRTSGTGWGQGAISTAKWTGVRLSDLLRHAGLEDAVSVQENYHLNHVRMHALDGMSASVGIEKIMNPYGDCILAYEMNDQILPRDHGYPLRVIIPGYAGIRNVKWVSKIELAEEEAEGPWQRGLNYKILPPSITDANEVDIENMPSVMEPSLFSGITSIGIESDNENDETNNGTTTPSAVTSDGTYKPGDRVIMKASGWAWAGGGRNIVRVDLTGDGGSSWSTADLKEGKDQRFGKAWAWTFWEARVPAIVQEDMSVELASKAIDNAFNVQPESSDHVWNVRGLGNNSWFHKKFFVTAR